MFQDSIEKNPPEEKNKLMIKKVIIKPYIDDNHGEYFVKSFCFIALINETVCQTNIPADNNIITTEKENFLTYNASAFSLTDEGARVGYALLI
ncbi:Uncharacterised protein [Mycoplasmopsis arginini]|nr:Uncharacterised protein [Chlamydia trachomatis]SGA03324.1 Uncharacterised protein [Chlamydia abortus]SGA23947.1 Uncharacterised protein [Mycoplasmopsis arginini]CRH48032.1 Uncharacterised protein [Chlamydia trachomatis]CRH54976.1 Uncharacterised protein [Chlamydia trachomatis]